MIRVKLGVPSYNFRHDGYTLETQGDIMLINYKPYNTIIVNKAHEQPNIAVFARLCKRSNIHIKICGLLNKYTEQLLPDVDVFEE